MSGVARKGDTSDHGLGQIKEPAIVSNVFVNSEEIAIGGGSQTAAGAEDDGLYVPSTPNSGPVHPQGCGTDNIPDPIAVPGPTTGSPNVFAAGIPVHRLGDRRGCGAETNVASFNVFANDPGTLIAPGATVQDPIEGPLSPVNFSYPISEMIMFVGSNILYTRTGSWESLQGIEDLSAYGTSLVPQLTGGEGPGGLDIDLATRTEVSENDNTNSETVLGGLIIRGFPSFGNILADEAGIIQGTPTQSNLNFHFIEENIGTPPMVYYRPNIKPTSMEVRNESGSASLDLSIVVLPGPEILQYII